MFQLSVQDFCSKFLLSEIKHFFATNVIQNPIVKEVLTKLTTLFSGLRVIRCMALLINIPHFLQINPRLR